MNHSQIVPPPTGSFPAPHSRIISLPYGDAYEVLLRVTDDNRVVRVEEIRVKRDFLSPEQRIASSSYIDVEEFYQD